jgi:hypothetical protein
MTVRALFDAAALVAGGSGGLALLVTLRERRALIRAQAADVQATGFARIMDAAGRGLEHQTELVPSLMDRIARLEGREEAREAVLAAVRTQLDRAEVHAATVEQWVQELRHWAADHRVWDQSAVEQIEQLGGHIAPPPPIPDRRHPPTDPDGLPVPAGAHT